MNRGAWWATVHGVTQSRTRLSHVLFQHIVHLKFTQCCMSVTFLFFFFFNFSYLFIFGQSIQHARPNSPTRGQTWAPSVKVQSSNHWTAREFPSYISIEKKKVWKAALLFQVIHFSLYSCLLMCDFVVVQRFCFGGEGSFCCF